MFVLGIDPGITRCGYGCVARADGVPLRAVAAGVLTTPREAPLPERLATLQSDLADLLADLRPDVVVVERVLFSANVRTAMATGQASGLALAEAHRRGCEVATYSPNEVKLAVAGDGGADKAQVQRMVVMLLGLAETPKPADAADALALALTHLAGAGLRTRARTAATIGGTT
jgi:crossover junction endodeoxyribonuclease RuvC